MTQWCHLQPLCFLVLYLTWGSALETGSSDMIAFLFQPWIHFDLTWCQLSLELLLSICDNLELRFPTWFCSQPQHTHAKRNYQIWFPIHFDVAFSREKNYLFYQWLLITCHSRWKKGSINFGCHGAPSHPCVYHFWLFWCYYWKKKKSVGSA